MPPIDEILDYWFGDDLSSPSALGPKKSIWFTKNPQIDADIKARFGRELETIGSADLKPWRQSPRGTLALVILTDQFSRNIYRDTAMAFSFDTLALHQCLSALALHTDEALHVVEQSFLLMPLMHAEHLAIQDFGVECFARLAQNAPKDFQGMLSGNHDYAIRHRDIIARFGRFPHRNAILGRTSTAEEKAFLQTPGSSF